MEERTFAFRVVATKHILEKHLVTSKPKVGGKGMRTCFADVRRCLLCSAASAAALPAFFLPPAAAGSAADSPHALDAGRFLGAAVPCKQKTSQ
jgi:hypothetical protein